MKNEKITGKIISSIYRRKILQALIKINRTPKRISEITNIRIQHVSMYIKDLEEYGLISCLNPSIRKGKIYSITEKGKKILKEAISIINNHNHKNNKKGSV